MRQQSTQLMPRQKIKTFAPEAAEREPVPVKAAADPFMVKLESKLSEALDQVMEPKDMNALFANAIKFLAIKMKDHGVDGDGDWND
jgi:hypothetical protein